MIYNNVVQDHSDKDGNIDYKMFKDNVVQGHSDKDGNIDLQMIYNNAAKGQTDKIIRFLTLQIFPSEIF